MHDLALIAGASGLLSLGALAIALRHTWKFEKRSHRQRMAGEQLPPG